jgi:Fur family ferric uptake transcriptional regulator
MPSSPQRKTTTGDICTSIRSPLSDALVQFIPSENGPVAVPFDREIIERPAMANTFSTGLTQDPGPETDSVLELLRQRGHRMTEQRRAIVLEIMSTRGHIVPADIAGRVQEKEPGVNSSTVYRTVELLEEVGVLTHAHVERGPEYHHAGEHNHVHLVCSSCGAERSLPVGAVDSARDGFVAATGFVPDFTHYAVWGLCEDCDGQGLKDGSKP